MLQNIGDFTPKFSIRLLNSRGAGGQKIFKAGSKNFSIRPGGGGSNPAGYSLTLTLPKLTHHLYMWEIFTENTKNLATLDSSFDPKKEILKELKQIKEYVFFGRIDKSSW